MTTKEATAAGVFARFPHLRGDLRGGFASALLGLPYAVTSAMLAFAPLGPDYVAHALYAGLLTSLVAGLVTSVAGGTNCQINGPRASAAVLMASLVALAAAHPAMRTSAGIDVPRVLGVTMLCLILCGLLQVAFGVLRMGSVVRFLPYPVISGFMVGLGILVAGPQLPIVLGDFVAGHWLDVFRLKTLLPGAILVGVVTVFVFVTVRSHWPRVPAPIAAMVVGTLLHYLLQQALPALPVGATAWDTLAGRDAPPMPWTVPQYHFDMATFWVLTDLLPAVATLAFVASLESLLSSSVVSIVSNMRYNSQRELVGQGLSNIAVACVGGVVSSGAPFRGVTNYNAGGRTRASAAVNGLLIGGVGLALSPVLFLVPLAAWAGVLAVVGWDVALTWWRRLAGNPRAELAVGFLVLFSTLALGTVPAILVGIAGSVLLYVQSTSRSPIRGHYDASRRASLRVRPEAHAEALKELGARVRVVELQGALFFGTADRCGREVEDLAAGAEALIVDLRRVTQVDSTGALVLMQTLRRLTERGTRVSLATVSSGGRRGRMLVSAGVAKIVSQAQWFPDIDRALEHEENVLLERHRPDLAEGELVQELGVEDMDVCAGLDPREVSVLGRYLRRETLPSGATLFAEQDQGDAMYLIARGAVTVSMAIGTRSERRRRLATYSPGVVVGEMAVLEGKPRSAAGICEGETVLYVLERTALERMAVEEPAAHGRFLLNLSRQIGTRLRATNLALSAALE